MATASSMSTHLQMISIPATIVRHLVLEWVTHELLGWLVKVMRLRWHSIISVEVVVVVILVIVMELLLVHSLIL